ncbi:hypothetical protein JHK87_031089 [Glycine soja]|nr:hypothetical protein JHK87_031089 [Glycine soja]
MPRYISFVAEKFSSPLYFTFHRIHATEKRHRVPSAYNRFIKEEIQRIKASNPDISHREAFSSAAKNESTEDTNFSDDEVSAPNNHTTMTRNNCLDAKATKDFSR